MTRPIVRCRCGHRVLAKEVLRTDLYERPSGREYVYVKYRCKRCKRLGETFVAENRWDWRIFETARTEMSEIESDTFADQSPITQDEVIEFHRQLQTINQAADLKDNDDKESTPLLAPVIEPTASKPRSDPKRSETKREFKPDLKNDHKAEPKTRPSETGTGDDSP